MLDEKPAAAADDVKPPRHAQALGGGAHNALGDLGSLKQVGGFVARALREVFEPLLRCQLKIAAEAPRLVRFDEYAEARPSPAAFVTLTMEPLLGHAVAVIDGEMIFEMLDLFYGGNGHVPTPMPAEFPLSAEAIARRAVRGVADRLGVAWRDIAEIAFVPDRFEANGQLLSGIEPDDRFVLTRFVIAEVDNRRSTLDILYPVAGLKPIALQLGARVKGRGGDPAWFSALARNVMDVKLPVRSVLAEPVVPLSRLMNLKPGDIIPISFGPEVPLFVADNRFARGSVGAANGRAAIKVARIEYLPDEDKK
jgi:flagellar motor switch protein FliM